MAIVPMAIGMIFFAPAQPFQLQRRLRNSVKSFLTLAYDNFADR